MLKNTLKWLTEATLALRIVTASVRYKLALAIGRLVGADAWYRRERRRAYVARLRAVHAEWDLLAD